MWLFKRKTEAAAPLNEQKPEQTAAVKFDPSVLKKNNITRLSIDERWTKLFVAIKMNADIEKAEKEMNELIKQEAMLRNEQDNLEPKKRKCMSEIISLTKEAFENNNDEAKARLTEYKKEIEKINTRMNDILEDIEKFDDTLKGANLKLLEDSTTYIFATLKANKDRAKEIQDELLALEQKEKALREELDTIKVDWTQYAVDLTELLGSDQVKSLEVQYGLEGLRNEAGDASTDEGH